VAQPSPRDGKGGKGLHEKEARKVGSEADVPDGVTRRDATGADSPNTQLRNLECRGHLWSG